MSADTVANSRAERDKTVAHLASMSRAALLQNLVNWTVAAQDLAEEGRELRRQRSESRAMLELIAAELRSRTQPVVPEAAAS